MATIIYPSPIFGPVRSRRLGISLGINLMPSDGKICTFDCIYCECGFNSEHRPKQMRPTRGQVAQQLEAKLQQMQAEHCLPDVLTFAGNGEPTAHPDFAEIIGDTITLRNRYCPEAKVSVLSNATRIADSHIRAALMQVDNNIQKLDTVSIDYINRVDRPVGNYDLPTVIRAMKQFNGHVIVQTMFMKGTFDGHSVNNTTPQYVGAWLQTLREIAPQQVMIYTIDRETPAKGLQKATREELDAIKQQVEQLGIACTASY